MSYSDKDGSTSQSRYYEGNDEQVLCAWFQELMGVTMDHTNLKEELKSGVFLCELANRLCPGVVRKINRNSMPWAQRENIHAFCEAAKALGVKDISNFTADDLFEAKNMRQVVICLHALGQQAHVIPDYTGPCLGPHPESVQSGGNIPGSARKSSAQDPPGSEEKKKTYKWSVKPGGSYTPKISKRASEEEEPVGQQQQQRKWEVKFAPQLATATRRTIVTVSKDVMQLMNQVNSETLLRTAVGGGGSVGGGFSTSSTTTSVKRETGGSGMPRLENLSISQQSADEQEYAATPGDHLGAGDGVMGGDPSTAGGENGPEEEDLEPEEGQEYEEEEGQEYGSDDGQGNSSYSGVAPTGVVEGLMMMLTSPDPTEKAKAAAALCNICSETDANRELVVRAGGLPSLIDMLMNPSPEVPFMQSAAAACICNLAANLNSKEIIATSGALQVLVDVLQSDNQAAAAQAAGALWSLCVDNDANKQRVAEAGAIPHLVALLKVNDSFAQSQSAGALSECSIRNDNNKRIISHNGAIQPLVKMLKSPDLSVQRLSSCALCNVCANHEANKRQAREVGALPVLVHLLSTSQVPEVLSPVAGAICNLSMKCPENKAEFLKLGVKDVLRRLVASPIPSLHSNALAALEQL
eukprot:CAMPEP_0113683348 /NCGR_PEP_ID=MMETSP0038_2-20120614/13244_1 /TAXON_ID=2898 /ORGANISM="Cryptomonas paramecium" /LENGTH=637 /DNA_ID=CAMNT_0000602669 /DNA_START=144 /DNA_END=2053 /DNA_ORIENTATION=+ /assembly_acc=CAM_ASM_000170